MSTTTKEDTMKAPWRTVCRIVCSFALVAGLMYLLIETRSTGEAIETLKLHFLPGALPTIAGGVMVLAIAGLAAIYFSDHRGKTKHP